jgi:hypothetical protein
MSTLAPEEAKNYRIEINGYAIVSDDDRIAGPTGLSWPPCATKRIGIVSSGPLPTLSMSCSAVAATNSRPTSGGTNGS